MEITKLKDNTEILKQGIKNLVQKECLVGIFNKEIAQEAYLTEYGENMLNITPNPFFFEGIDKAKSETLSIMKKGARDILMNKDTITNVLSNAGEANVDSIVEEGMDKHIPSQVLNYVDMKVQ